MDEERIVVKEVSSFRESLECITLKELYINQAFFFFLTVSNKFSFSVHGKNNSRSNFHNGNAIKISDRILDVILTRTLTGKLLLIWVLKINLSFAFSIHY